ncbi:hypothetical protein GCM10010195_19080 [Kitasatospora griseola]|nr:hypothetical protein GCM10010195_19080 [Kitasatospora griseola]
MSPHSGTPTGFPAKTSPAYVAAATPFAVTPNFIAPLGNGVSTVTHDSSILPTYRRERPCGHETRGAGNCAKRKAPTSKIATRVNDLHLIAT